MDATVIRRAIKAARERAGLTQREVSEGIGVSPAAVAKWELVGGGITLANLFALAKLLNVRPSVLLGEHQPADAGVLPVSDPDERALIEAYRRLTDDQRSGLLRFLDARGGAKSGSRRQRR